VIASLRPVHWVLVFAAVAVLCVPLLGDAYYTRTATRVLVLGLIAASLNLLVGFGGMISFGHAAFVGLGAYTTSILAYHGVASGFFVWPAALAVAALGALVIGAIALRTSGVYFIMITLAFAQMLYYTSVGLERYGGDDGVRMAARSTFAGLLPLERASVYFYLVAAIVALVLFLIARLVRSRFGRVLRGIKDNERRMQSLGYNTYLYKLTAFVVAGVIAGLGGVLNANLVQLVSPSMLHWIVSGDLLVMVILGGVGTIWGPVIGAAAFILLEEVLSSYTKHWMIVLGPMLLLVVMFQRGGIHALLFRRGDARG
jgi:branched-chain amino acid transport system permease protein